MRSDVGTTPSGDSDTVYTAVASPSFTNAGPLMETVIGSLSAMVATAELLSGSTNTREARSPDIVPSVTENVSAASERLSSTTATSMVCVAPAAEFAAKVTVPDLSATSSVSAVPGIRLHATVTSAATWRDSVTVNTAVEPSGVSSDGGSILR